MTIEELTKQIIEFREKRNWKPFHHPKNLAMAIIIELGELFELYFWDDIEQIKKKKNDPESKVKFADELADVAIYLFTLAHELGINLDSAIPEKLKKNKKKYPCN